MLQLKKYILSVLFALIVLNGYSQKATVRASIQPSDILIGDHSTITLEVISPKGRDIQFPIFNDLDTLVKGIHVLKIEETDTLMTEVMILKKKYIVSSYDSTLYHIPYMQVIDGADTLRSNDIGLKVSAPQLSDSTLAYLEMMKNNETDSIDFDRLQIADIKDIQEPKFVIFDYIAYLLIPFVILLLIIMVVLIIMLVRNKTKKGYYFKAKELPPPHVEALESLEQLRSKKLAQQGLVKEYYTEATDIVRHYIERRFGIDAPEMITEDIVAEVRKVTEGESSAEGLSQILKLADLVKFAKYTPLLDENDLTLVNAFLFVNQTKKEELVLPDDKKDGAKGTAASSETKDANGAANTVENKK